jgi:hypothetical protein
MGKTLDDELAELRRAWLDLAYSLVKASGMLSLIRRMGLTPKDWIREREP